MKSFLQSALFIIFLFITNLSFIHILDLDDQGCAYLICSNFVYILWSIWNVNKLTPFMMFMCTFCILFIGGHFWGVLFNPELPLRIGSFLDPRISTDAEWKETMTYVILFLYLALGGYKYAYHRQKAKNDLNRNWLFQANPPSVALNNFLFFVFIPLCFAIISLRFNNLLMILTRGYHVLYTSASSDGYEAGNGFIMILEWFFFAMAMVYGNKKNRMLYITMFIIDGILQILGGTRGTFGSVMLFILWYFSMIYKINFHKIAIGGIAALFLLISLSSISKRVEDSGNAIKTFDDAVSMFFYAQGESLSTFESSRSVKEYPSLPYFQTFIPGSSYIYYNFFPEGKNMKRYEASFSLYLSSKLNYRRFEAGNGAGWTLMGDLYLFSGRTYLGFMLLTFLFAYLVGWLEISSLKNNLCKVILFTIILRFLILPRTGLNYIMPLIVYTLFLFYIIHLMYKLKIKNIS